MLTGRSDHDIDVEAMRAGALDYLVKGRFDSALLERSIRYAVERSRIQRRLEEAVDDLEDGPGQCSDPPGSVALLRLV